MSQTTHKPEPTLVNCPAGSRLMRWPVHLSGERRGSNLNLARFGAGVRATRRLTHMLSQGNAEGPVARPPGDGYAAGD